MGALGLEGWGRRPQGKGCLLLAVAGAASLVTLLLAVPITVLAVLVVAPPKPGLVSGCSQGRGFVLLICRVPVSPAQPARLALLCAGPFPCSLLLLPPDVSKPLPGCLSVSFPFPRLTRSCRSAQCTCAACSPLQGDGAGGRLGLQWEVGLASAGLTSGHCDPPAPSRWQSPLTPGHKHRPSSDWVRADRLPSRSSSRDSSPPSICTPPPLHSALPPGMQGLVPGPGAAAALPQSWALRPFQGPRSCRSRPQKPTPAPGPRRPTS